ncbi:TIGR01777 family oxidoreductase [Leptospira ellisii]|uniref:TIGR01777 family oxidoreductase n=1 Tax=Leptospira ellisii TaxID=2023197 RepID=A0A2N0BQR5_9LEPT|nr:TIGR01777 family oxidoreductase [Leptospira ellisii]MDV6235444.1 TIGR01777 family oxidoreductase [Leptospira ellisii]PJZ91253.1 TIGR01777 family protein [Leptospira ellisii]PKA06340.1 TIGR01777 family protein [Leptospira ellisii]
MKIGIAGGTGLIGSALTSRLIERGEKVRIFSRSPQFPRIFVGKANVEISSSLALKKEDLEDLDGIINLAGSPIVGTRWNESVKNLIRSSRIEYTQKLVESIDRIAGTPLKFYFQGSAIGYYGSYDNDIGSFTENSVAGDDFLASLSKEWESSFERIRPSGIRLCTLRTGVVLSLAGGALKKMLPPFKLGLGGPIGTGNQIMSWIHINDIVNAILFLIDHDNLSGTFNLVSPSPVSNEFFSNVLAETLNRPSYFRVPTFVIRRMFGEGADVILKGQSVLPTKLLEAGFNFDFPELDSALRDLLRK